ncbi:GMC family oxidoreductase [Pseudobacteriovorax antillogorgiicola]|nr:GMC family oxidoreductase [Pseudobacteriovorax antillogorgiicola]
MSGVIYPSQKQKNFELKDDQPNHKIILTMELSLQDPPSLLRDGHVSGTINGWVESDALGGISLIEDGMVSLFTNSMLEDVEREMTYSLVVKSPMHGLLTIDGRKLLRGLNPLKIWYETTTLMLHIRKCTPRSKTTESLFEGQASVSAMGLIHHLRSMTTNCSDSRVAASCISQFLAGFVRNCYEIYAQPMASRNQTLSDQNSIPKFQDTIVIGSGYGGAISAARLASKGYPVAILERGREFKSGDFPDSSLKALREFQVNHFLAPRNPSGLFDFRTFDDAAVVVGCGLGGTSLINANVVAPPDPGIFSHSSWPEAIRRKPQQMNRYFHVVSSVLAAKPFPESGEKPLAKRRLFREFSQKHQIPLTDPPLAINFDGSCYNKFGVKQSPCISCGNCCSGCNYGAKNSLDKNYLPMAKSFGARIFTGIEVSHIEKLDNHDYQVYYWNHSSSKASKRQENLQVVRCRQLILAAGALGSPEILLRSRELGGIQLSSTLGKSFSLNGGTIGWIYNTDKSAHPIGFNRQSSPEKRRKSQHRKDDYQGEERRKSSAFHKVFKAMKSNRYRPQVGPTITNMLDYRSLSSKQQPHQGGFVIEDSSIPGVLSPLLPWAVTISSFKFGQSPGDLKIKSLAPIARSLIKGSYQGAIDNSLALLGVGQDRQQGQVFLPDYSGTNDLLRKRLDLSWPGLNRSPWYKEIHREFNKFQQDLGGIFVDYNGLGLNRPISVHPLGGCAMGESHETGVVNHRCETFDPQGGIHKGLYVCDGSIIPTSIGTNPLLTISALTERSMDYIQNYSAGEAPKYMEPLPRKRFDSPDIPNTKRLVQFSQRFARGFQYQTTTKSSSHLRVFAKHTQWKIRANDGSLVTLTRLQRDFKARSCIILMPDIYQNFEDYTSGAMAPLSQAVLDQGYDLVIADSRLTRLRGKSHSIETFDHVAAYDIPIIMEDLGSLSYEHQHLISPGFSNFASLLACNNILFRSISSYISLGISFIPNISPAWRKTSSISKSFQWIPGLSSSCLPRSYQSHLERMIRTGHICRFHNRKQDYLSSLPKNPVEDFVKSGIPTLFIAGKDDRLFKSSQKDAFALLEELSPGKHQYIEIPKYNYPDLISSPKWNQDVGNWLFPFLRLQEEKKRGLDPANSM